MSGIVIGDRRDGGGRYPIIISRSTAWSGVRPIFFARKYALQYLDCSGPFLYGAGALSVPAPGSPTGP
jgi:hypothetical protein